MIIQPTDLPALRVGLGRWIDESKGWWEATWRKPPELATRRPLRQNLDAAELFYVAPEMARLAMHAADSLPDYVLRIEDVPAPAGFLYTPETLHTTIYEETILGVPQTLSASVTGIYWTVAAANEDYPHGAVIIVRLADKADFHRQLRDAGYVVTGSAPGLYLPFSTTAWPLSGDSYQWGSEEEARHDRHYPDNRIFKTIWRLMQQPLIVNEAARFDRAARRRLERQQVPPAAVRVIRLRRGAHGDSNGQQDHEHFHQWVVRGHWRQQPYGPKGSLRRPVWIAPHVKGPEGAPLLGGEKVHAWVR
ncbi:hypothetical protein AB0F17_08740 [Nonomuraea sp. NPDC026600]|uniref:hypothetical protein n=1 Tax=Nonomuraea sp. NPDC026600 TaxID=3155363 RepID=UPI0033D1DD61